MYRNPPVNISKSDLISCCKAMQVMARGVVFARENTVEIDRRPDLILQLSFCKVKTEPKQP
jgi:hypothetical protein